MKCYLKELPITDPPPVQGCSFATRLEAMISLEVPALSGTSGQSGHTLDETSSFKLTILANSKSTFNNSDAPYKTNEIKIISGNIWGCRNNFIFLSLLYS